ncbi:AraC family transcriptional regulator [Marinobacterium sedimentorum]|uniref:AraC family transcriptional regulator n=1 Tax=Marinobacterium sedimentorum TaxID=2927804 RepID=UPI0020C70EDA|nr:AraC family transcriptional regulator [Marinobacterium sedimentorum]MCP8690528.1 AraC family transcriptional regulator [Marinobacterium sedimentorum]
MLGIHNLVEGRIKDTISTEILDAEAARSWMESICGPHYLKVKNTHSIRFRHVGNILTSTTTAIGHIEYGTDVTVEIDDLHSSYSISLPVSGFQALEGPSLQAQSDISRGVIISPSTACRLHISGNCRKTLVRISRQAMEAGLENLLRRPVTEPLIFQTQMDAAIGANSAWWRTIRHIENELRCTNGLYNSSHFIREMEQALIKGIIVSQPNNYSQAIEQLSCTSIPAYLARTIEFIKKHAHDDISIEDIEQAASVSRNKLYNDFKKYIGEPPTSHLKRIRLEGARQDILTDSANENISSIAMKWGFYHLGRFSVDYKKQFNESPSESVQRIKNATSF